MKVRNVLLAGLALLAAAGPVSGLVRGGVPAAHAASPRPNVVFVLTDDMRPDEMTMTANLRPNGGFDWIRGPGVAVKTYIRTDQLCCPRRPTPLTAETSYN